MENSFDTPDVPRLRVEPVKGLLAILHVNAVFDPRTGQAQQPVTPIMAHAYTSLQEPLPANEKPVRSTGLREIDDGAC
jgi:hypothetical protein